LPTRRSPPKGQPEYFLYSSIPGKSRDKTKGRSDKRSQLLDNVLLHIM
jgi:hypothetical protein